MTTSASAEELTQISRNRESLGTAETRGSLRLDERRALTPGLLKRRLVLADATALAAGFGLAFLLRGLIRPEQNWLVLDHALVVLASMPGFVAGAVMNRLYQARANERPSQERANVLRAVGVGVGCMLAFTFAIQYQAMSRLWVVLLAVCTAGALVLERAIARRVFGRLRAEQRLSRRIVIVGTDPHAIGLLHHYERNPHLGYQVVGFVGDDQIGRRGGVGVLGRLDDLEQVLDDHAAVGVVVSLASVGDERVNRLTRRLTDEGYHVALSSGLADIDVTRLRPQALDGRTMIYIEPVVRDGVRGLAKRVFDVTLASLILLATLPLWVMTALLIKLDSRGPVLFKQQRVGLDGHLFTMLKFRTMVADAEQRKGELVDQNEADGPLFKMERDPRVTRVGRFLRKLSIDELPQLITVLRGDMSMVGPRPALPDEVHQWEPELHDRLRVLPGLTGMWQVSGRSDAGFESYRRLDLYYVDNWSLTHDLRICMRTVGVVLTGRGAA